MTRVVQVSDCTSMRQEMKRLKDQLHLQTKEITQLLARQRRRDRVHRHVGASIPLFFLFIIVNIITSISTTTTITTTFINIIMMFTIIIVISIAGMCGSVCENFRHVLPSFLLPQLLH